MTQSEFITKVIGKPWVDRACSMDKMDCWGLVVLYYRHVMGKELQHSDNYDSMGDFVQCYDDILWQWVDGGFSDTGCMVTFYNGDNPNHVGINIGGGKILHSRGEGGSVKVDHLAAMLKVYTRVEFKKYASL